MGSGFLHHLNLYTFPSAGFQFTFLKAQNLPYAPVFKCAYFGENREVERVWVSEEGGVSVGETV